MNFDKDKAQRHPNHNQVVLQAKLRKAQSGVEMLDFVIPLGVAELHCSCPIPDEGTEGSPVYVHVKSARPTLSFGGPVAVGPRRRRSNGGEDFDEDYGNRA